MTLLNGQGFKMKTKLVTLFLGFIFLFLATTCSTDKNPISTKEKEPDYILKFRQNDYDYLRNQFFLVNSYFQSHFESNFNPLTMQWVVNNSDYRIYQLDVWMSTRPTDPDSRPGWAVVDPNSVNPDSMDYLQVISGIQENGYFRHLDESEYHYDEYRGFFWLNKSAGDQDVVAIAYQLVNGFQEGILFNQITSTSQILLLKMIQAQGANPNFPTWGLTMRNVYNLGATFIRRDEFDVKVIYTKTGKDITVQPLGERKTFNYLVGLDRLKENGEPVNGGDGKVEAGNSLIFNLTDGFLIFPSLTPFDPTLSYQFKFDSTLKVDIYNSKNRSWELLQHKFEIQTAILDTAVQPY